jgi:hypothetical protein
MSNPLEKIENDRKLTSILNGLRGIFQYGDEFLCIALYHTEDFELASDVIIEFMNGDENVTLEEALFKSMPLEEFKEKCLNSDYLNYEKCKNFVN